MDRAMIESMFNALEEKDLERLMSFFAEDALFIDPHYPEPEMKGIAAIRKGCEWAFQGLEKPGIQIRNCWIDGDKAAVEVATHHITKEGMILDFPQMFSIEMHKGCIIRMQAYVPYPPPKPAN